MSGILGIGVSSLLAYQRGLAVTAHNIANATNEGYSRQRVLFSAGPGQAQGSSFFGSGVQVSQVQRIYDELVDTQLRSATSSKATFETFNGYAQRVDRLLADPDSGLSPGMQKFFAAAQDVSNDPTSTPARTVLITESESLVDRLRFLDQRIQDQRNMLRSQIETTVQEINGFADSIARLNADISVAQVRGQPNDLLDQRDSLVRELSERINVTTLEQSDGSLNVFIGNGQSLVAGRNAEELVARPPREDASGLGIAFVRRDGSELDVSSLLTGGRLGALLDVRSSVLDTAQNSLGRVALGLAVAFNDQHQQGMNLEGDRGENFFSLGRLENSSGEIKAAVQGRAQDSSAGVPEVVIADYKSLTVDDYRLRFDGSNWSIQAVSGKEAAVVLSGNDQEVFGLQITIPEFDNTGGLWQKGDSFIIQPTRTVAAQFNVAIDDPKRVAAAAFDPAGPVPGDNTNMLALVALQQEKLLDGGRITLDGGYETMIGEVATLTRRSEIAFRAQERLYDQALAQRESISGVNLDEEAANLIRYQQLYQASAQVVSTVNVIFESLLSVLRR